jgi:hypothetical protein
MYLSSNCDTKQSMSIDCQFCRSHCGRGSGDIEPSTREDDATSALQSVVPELHVQSRYLSKAAWRCCLRCRHNNVGDYLVALEPRDCEGLHKSSDVRTSQDHSCFEKKAPRVAFIRAPNLRREPCCQHGRRAENMY